MLTRRLWVWILMTLQRCMAGGPREQNWLWSLSGRDSKIHDLSIRLTTAKWQSWASASSCMRKRAGRCQCYVGGDVARAAVLYVAGRSRWNRTVELRYKPFQDSNQVLSCNRTLLCFRLHNTTRCWLFSCNCTPAWISYTMSPIHWTTGQRIQEFQKCTFLFLRNALSFPH